MKKRTPEPSPLIVSARSGRRDFLKGCTALAMGLVLPPALAKTAPAERSLAFLNLHTGERLQRTYWQRGEYLAEPLSEINWLLRDHRTGDVERMDRKLLDLLYLLQRKTGSRQAFHVISGYRSPRTNAMLRQHSDGIAKKSLHTQGRAIDIRLPGVQLAQLQRAALSLRVGGVGYYPASDFIHVDTGRVRTW